MSPDNAALVKGVIPIIVHETQMYVYGKRVFLLASALSISNDGGA